MIMSGSVSSEKCIPIKMHVILYRKVNYYSGGELLQTVGGTSFCSVNASPLSCSPLPNGFKYAFCVCTLKENRGNIQFCVSFRDICLTGTMFWSRMMMQKKNRSDRLITRISGLIMISGSAVQENQWEERRKALAYVLGLHRLLCHKLLHHHHPCLWVDRPLICHY